MVLSRLRAIVAGCGRRSRHQSIFVWRSFLNVQKYKNADSGGGGGPIVHDTAIVCVIIVVLELPDHKSIRVSTLSQRNVV